MGKCLSCCEQQPNEEDQRKPKKAGGGSGAVASPSAGGGTGGPVGRDDDPRQRLGAGRGPNDNDGEPNARNGVAGEKPSRNPLFHPRIPPLLAAAVGGGGESKRGSSGHSREKECSESKILAFYEQYRDPHEDAILTEGIERLCHDLELRPEEFRVLVLAWKFGAETMCRFSRAEFVGGCRALRVCSARGIQARLPELLRELDEQPDKFKELYRFTFGFGLDAEVGQRVLPADMAALLWRLVFSRREPPLLARWLTFLEGHPGVRGVPRDTWNMFLNFLEAVGEDLSQYDDAEAWPSLFDDFVDCVRYENDQANQNVVVQRKDDGGNELRIS